MQQFMWLHRNSGLILFLRVLRNSDEKSVKSYQTAMFWGPKIVFILLFEGGLIFE